MPKTIAPEVVDKTEMVNEISAFFFGKAPQSVEQKTTGLTNFVFEVNVASEIYIIRIGGSPAKLYDYQKEQWAVTNMEQKGIPVAEILEVGNQIIDLPFMIQRKVEGKDALHHPKALDIVRQMGEYAAIIHSMPTHNFGKVFDWSDNKLSKNETWKDYLNNEFKADLKLEILENNTMLSSSNLKKIKANLKKIKDWERMPMFNHGDLRLKNVIIGDDCKIAAIIDWENCCSNIAPEWDLSIALHDLDVDQKQQFLEGYGLDVEEYKDMSLAMKTFNILNYADEIQKIIDAKETAKEEQYRLRLNGYYDLYTL